MKEYTINPDKYIVKFVIPEVDEIISFENINKEFAIGDKIEKDNLCYEITNKHYELRRFDKVNSFHDNSEFRVPDYLFVITYKLERCFKHEMKNGTN